MSAMTPHLLSAYYSQHRKKFGPNYIFPIRTTTTYELAYLINDGHCQLSLDQTLYTVKGDAIVFRRPGQVNQSFMPYDSFLLSFDVEGSDAMAMLHALPVIYQSKDIRALRQLFEDVYKESLSNRPYAHVYHTGKLIELIYTIYQDSQAYLKLHNKHITNDHLLTMLNYIDQHLDQAFTIETMSADLSLSQRHIYYLFKEHMATTPIRYINECRLNLAKGHLLNSNLPIHQIAHLCGYENPTYFITLFRKYCGTSPAKYRQSAL